MNIVRINYSEIFALGEDLTIVSFEIEDSKFSIWIAMQGWRGRSQLFSQVFYYLANFLVLGEEY